MLKMKITTSFLLFASAVSLTGCATTPENQFNGTSPEELISKVVSTGKITSKPLNGEYKELSAVVFTNSGNLVGRSWECSGEPTRKILKYLEIEGKPNGQISGSMRVDDCGKVTQGPVQGFQTATNLYVYGNGSGVVNYSGGGIIASETVGARSNGRDVTRYAIHPSSGLLKSEGVYRFSKGRYKFEKAKADGDSWTRMGLQKMGYQTSNFLPQTYWSQIPTFEASIDAGVLARKKEGSQGGFQWGKALALGVGAAAGGGLKLDTDTQANIMSGIVLDSMGDTNGTNNLNAAVNNAATSTKNNGLDNVGKFNSDTGEFDFDDEVETASQSNSSFPETAAANTQSAPANSDFKPVQFCGKDATQQGKYQEFLEASKRVSATDTTGGTYKERAAVQNELNRLSSEYAAWEQAYKLEQCGPGKKGPTSATIE